MSGAVCELGYIVKDRLIALDRNQTWLASKCNVTRGQISHIIYSRCNPSIKLLKSLSSVLEIDSKVLLEASFKK